MTKTERVLVDPSEKGQHGKGCSRRNSKRSEEELLVVRKGIKGNWCVFDLYRCPECGAEIRIYND